MVTVHLLVQLVSVVPVVHVGPVVHLVVVHLVPVAAPFIHDLSIDLAIRLAVAAAAGFFIGLERELTGSAAGMRTHSLVAMGACLFTVTGAYGFADVTRGASYDPSRIAAQVASGIGFVGAGAILRNARGVRGITTAATLWMSAALGVAAGAGMHLPVLVSCLLTVVLLVTLRALREPLAAWRGLRGTVVVQYHRGHGTLAPLLTVLGQASITVGGIDIEDDDHSTQRSVRLGVQGSRRADRSFVEDLKGVPGVESVVWLDDSE